MMPPPTYLGDDAATPAAPKPTIAEAAKTWARDLPNPLTFRRATDEMSKLAEFGWAIVDRVCSGSICPTRAQMVEVGSLNKGFDEAFTKIEKLRDGFSVYVKKGAGDAPMADLYRTKTIEIATEFFAEADRQTKDTVTEHNRLSSLIPNPFEQGSGGFWKTAVVVGLGIAGIIAVKDLIHSVRD